MALEAPWNSNYTPDERNKRTYLYKQQLLQKITPQIENAHPGGTTFKGNRSLEIFPVLAPIVPLIIKAPT